jgi:hypothetical protein
MSEQALKRNLGHLLGGGLKPPIEEYRTGVALAGHWDEASNAPLDCEQHQARVFEYSGDIHLHRRLARVCHLG